MTQKEFIAKARAKGIKIIINNPPKSTRIRRSEKDNNIIDIKHPGKIKDALNCL
jgi:hypothetical protein